MLYNTISVLLGYGNGLFRDEYLYGAGIYPTSLISNYFNNDPSRDLTVVDTLSNDISILLNQC